jgi:hypothetical protein
VITHICKRIASKSIPDYIHVAASALVDAPVYKRKSMILINYGLPWMENQKLDKFLCYSVNVDSAMKNEAHW